MNCIRVIMGPGKYPVRAHSRYAEHVTELLGQRIRRARIARRMTVQELADRAGVSRALVTRVEKGAMGTAIGTVFELAAIVGLVLFDEPPGEVRRALDQERTVAALLPRAVRPRAREVDDDF